MTVAYSPALEVSDSPASSPTDKPFTGGGGGGSAFDMDAEFTASEYGDFWKCAQSVYTDDGTTPATSDGDLIYRMDGNRTTNDPAEGGPLILRETNASFRPELDSDATYGLVYKATGSANKRLLDLSWNPTASTKDWTIGARMRLGTVSVAGSLGTAIQTEDISNANSFFGVWDDGTADLKLQASITSTDAVKVAGTGLTDWFTLVFKFTSATKGVEIYKDGSLAASGTLSGTLNWSRLVMMTTSTQWVNDAFYHRTFMISKLLDESNARGWLEGTD